MILVPAMWTPSLPELAIVLVLVMVFFGAGKLPAVFKQLGSGLKAFKDAQKDLSDDPVDVTPERKALSSDPVADAEEVGERVRRD